MANTVTSPNMSLPVPVVGTDPGPDWANNVNSCLSIIDGHNHTAGSGVPITPAAININTDLPLNGNNLTSIRTARFSPQSSTPSLPADLGCLYEGGVDLYYIDGAGNNIRLTQSGSPSGATGTITGLPSGTASASFAASTFTFQSATSTPANMNVGPVTIGNNVPSSFGVTIAPNIGIGANYNLFLPVALPASGAQALSVDSSGNITLAQGYNSVGMVPIGAVIPTMPQLSGAYITSATTVGDNQTGYVLCQGQTIADARSPMNGQVVPDLTGQVFLNGYNIGGQTGGHLNLNLDHNHNISHAHQALYRETAILAPRFFCGEPIALIQRPHFFLMSGAGSHK